MNKKLLISALMCVHLVAFGQTQTDLLPDRQGIPENHTLPNGMRLLWHDEFNGQGSINTHLWKFEQGFVRNEEDQWYQPQNASMRNGVLEIVGKEEKVTNPNYDPSSKDWKKNRQYAYYTSASIRAQDPYAFQYGTVIVRAKIPAVQGSWPAIWSTGTQWIWPLKGEIDMMEYYKDQILANVCWGADKPNKQSWDTTKHPFERFLQKDAQWADKYHIWRMDWDKHFIRLYLDNELLNETDLSLTVNPWDYGTGEGAGENPFTAGFGQAMMLNLAIGGINGRPITCSFPITYYVDYIRVYQHPNP